MKPDYTSTRVSYVTVLSIGLDGKTNSFHQVPQLPGRLGNAATQLVASALVKGLSLRT